MVDCDGVVGRPGWKQADMGQNKRECINVDTRRERESYVAKENMTNEAT